MITLDRQDSMRTETDQIPRDLTEWDYQTFQRLISLDLSDEQEARIIEPAKVFPQQEAVIALHWHPEFIPMPLIMERVRRTFPNCKKRLIIPTQHNVLLTLDGYAGVEVDCYSRGFNLKVQLLLHFEENKVAKADVLRAMLAHTFKYRCTQLFEFLDTLIEPSLEHRLAKPADDTGTEEDLIEFTRLHAIKLRKLIDLHESTMPPESVKNKLLAHYLDALREHYPDKLINHVQVFLKAVKKVVKDHFTLNYFYQTEEIIEEARSLHAGIVIPHPEQFWPILLADYDVDGYEVWNPQSRQYTEFLINVVDRQNRTARGGQKPLLVFMGDDCHMGEKAIDPRRQDREKSSREIGVQAAWEDVAIRKSLIVAGIDRMKLIEQYQARLA